jgi:hypothetical protein
MKKKFFNSKKSLIYKQKKQFDQSHSAKSGADHDVDDNETFAMDVQRI